MQEEPRAIGFQVTVAVKGRYRVGDARMVPVRSLPRVVSRRQVSYRLAGCCRSLERGGSHLLVAALSGSLVYRSLDPVAQGLFGRLCPARRRSLTRPERRNYRSPPRWRLADWGPTQDRSLPMERPNRNWRPCPGAPWERGQQMCRDGSTS